MAQNDIGKWNRPLMILAFISMAGLLYWLSVASEPTEFAVAQEEPEVMDLTILDFSADPQGYVGDQIRIPNLAVVEVMSTELVWLQFPDDQLYLVRLERALVDEGLVLLPGDRMTIEGQVEHLSQAVLENWMEAGAMQSMDDQERAAEQGTYIFVSSVELAGQEPEGDENDDPAGDA